MNIGFISTRLAGTDGVSLETQKIAAVTQELGHQNYYCAGELDPGLTGLLAPELHFVDETAVALGKRAFDGSAPDPELLLAIEQRAQELQRPLHEFVERYEIDYLILQNIFSIPMQLPLAQAVTEVMRETGLPGLAHNHDFYWERERFAVNRIPEFLDTYFPPALPGLQHAVINTAAQRSLRDRRGLESVFLPNVMDFATAAPGLDDYNSDFRQAIGLEEQDWLILQPTRVVARKGIELAIEMVAQLNDPRAKLVITHKAGDEGMQYFQELQQLAAARQVDMLYVADIVDDQRGQTAAGQKVYSLWDTYPHADFVTYPSIYEGFGNALLETIYFRLPALVNRYSVYTEDIGPLGFQFIEIEGEINEPTVNKVADLLADLDQAQRVVDHNYELALRYFSYQTVAEILQTVGL